MDSNEFRQRVQELAHIRDILPTALPTPRGSGRPRGRPRLGEVRDPQDITMNPSLGFEITGLPDDPRPCRMGCGQQVSHQTVEFRYAQNPLPHWKTRCANCQNYMNPNTPGFCRGTAVTNEYARYFRVHAQADLRINPHGIDK